jgi:hypothetical protein
MRFGVERGVCVYSGFMAIVAVDTTMGLDLYAVEGEGEIREIRRWVEGS